MKWLCILVIFFLCASCDSYSENDKEYFSFTSHQINIIKEKYGLKLYSLGGFNEEGLKGYSFGFISNEKVDIERARIQIVNVMEDLIKNGNLFFKNLRKNELIRDQYDVSILYMDNVTGSFYPSEIGLAEVSSYFGKIRYTIEPPSSTRLETLSTESYAEAYEKVTGKKLVENITQNSIE